MLCTMKELLEQAARRLSLIHICPQNRGKIARKKKRFAGSSHLGTARKPALQQQKNHQPFG